MSWDLFFSEVPAPDGSTTISIITDRATGTHIVIGTRTKNEDDLTHVWKEYQTEMAFLTGDPFEVRALLTDNESAVFSSGFQELLETRQTKSFSNVAGFSEQNGKAENAGLASDLQFG